MRYNDISIKSSCESGVNVQTTESKNENQRHFFARAENHFLKNEERQNDKPDVGENADTRVGEPKRWLVDTCAFYSVVPEFRHRVAGPDAGCEGLNETGCDEAEEQVAG